MSQWDEQDGLITSKNKYSGALGCTGCQLLAFFLTLCYVRLAWPTVLTPRLILPHVRSKFNRTLILSSISKTFSIRGINSLPVGLGIEQLLFGRDGRKPPTRKMRQILVHYRRTLLSTVRWADFPSEPFVKLGTPSRRSQGRIV